MSTTALVILIAVVVVAAVVLWAIVQERRTKALRSRFGTEYEQAVREYGDRARAERALEHRTNRTENYNIRLLNTQEQQRFSEAWRHTQAGFVDHPRRAIREADHLVTEVMRARGYPVADFEQRAEDLSVDHPAVVKNYRMAHGIAVSDTEGRATTEDLRRGLVYYRELFDDLLQIQPAGLDRRT